MNKKNILIIILLLIIAVLAYLRFEKKDIVTSPTHTEPKTIDPVSKPVVTKPFTSNNNAALEKIAISKGNRKGDKMTIYQCSVESKTYFASDDRPVDGSLSIYDTQGNLSADCGGGMTLPDPNNPRPAPAPICSKVDVYSSSCKSISYTR